MVKQPAGLPVEYSRKLAGIPAFVSMINIFSDLISE